MKKSTVFILMLQVLSGCSVLTELSAFKSCEFRLYSFQDPAVCGIGISDRSSWSDFSFMDAQAVGANLLRGTLPFDITVNVEARNPGTVTAAVHSIEWLAYIDELEVAGGTLDRPIEVPPSGGLAIIPLKVHADMFDFLEGDNPQAMMNFAMNLLGAGDQPSQISMKIKPSVRVGGTPISYPGFFTITREFSSGN
jgi:LEA14-like dessication related protein